MSDCIQKGVIDIIVKEVIYFGKNCVAACDNKCEKAFGLQARPSVQLDENNVDDIAWLADSEVGIAPLNTGWYEGGQSKPVSDIEKMNKWCVRECERSSIHDTDENIELKDWSQRVFNIQRT